MISFESDYIEGAHPKILEKLISTNMEQLSGYGYDKYTESAKEKIKLACNCKDAQVVLLNGGTQTNMIAISNVLLPYEGVIAPHTGHISCHEAGAIEASGHKVLELSEHNGKIDSQELEKYLNDYELDENKLHMVKPGMVFITHPTEYGTLYTKEELIRLHEICSEYNIPLYLDGARLGYGLMASGTDVTLSDIAKYTDIFYIGGTKIGALIGEALIFTKNNMPENFFTRIKRQGALLAKGRLLGIQFDTLFTDNLYFEISRHAISMANLLKNGLLNKGYMFYIESPTNQQFIILENNKYQDIKSKVGCSYWCKYDDNHVVVRFATSWATTKENVQLLIDLM